MAGMRQQRFSNRLNHFKTGFITPMSQTPESRDLDAAIFADRLGVVSMALFAVYLVSVLAFILPPRLLDPLWQLSSIKVAVEAAPIPLIGLALLHLGAYLCPADPASEPPERSWPGGPFWPLWDFC